MHFFAEVGAFCITSNVVLRNVSMVFLQLVLFLCLVVSAGTEDAFGGPQQQYPQGYYPFEESPAKIPPKVRKPPYLQTSVPCPGNYLLDN